MSGEKTGLFIFRRDFRMADNRGLAAACAECARVYVSFIFTPEQIGSENRFRSQPAVDFMIESLESLSGEIGGKLAFFYGKNGNVIKKLIKSLQIDTVYFNRDYSPYAIARDDEIDRICQLESDRPVECLTAADYYLYEPGTIWTGSGRYFKKFTPFYDHVIHLPVSKIQKGGRWDKIVAMPTTTDGIFTMTQMKKRFYRGVDKMIVGGREKALERLSAGLRRQVKYDETRDFLKNETTGLSAYIKFGCVSIREVYWAFMKKYGVDFGLVRELIWREFFAHVLYGYPEVLEDSYQPKYRRIRWSTSSEHFEKWCRGETGFPVVDACMRQLNATGYMHNRGRMIVANFLVKTLLIDWHLGERYFAQRLTDYDPASNNGNWQGISGTGVDMKPYFRDMNPWIQSAKFDRDAEFIKRWVPELKDVEAREIHRWNEFCKENGGKDVYAKPIVDYDEQKVKMLKMYTHLHR